MTKQCITPISSINRRKFVKYGTLILSSAVVSACTGDRQASTNSSSPASNKSAFNPVTVSKTDKVVASWLPIMQSTAYYVALEEKLFEKAGIEIESVKFENPNQIIDSLISGRADFGPPGTPAGIIILAESRALGTLKVFGLQGGGIKSNFINDGLIVKLDSSITSFTDLIGKKLGIIPGIQGKTIAQFVLRQNGLDPEKDVRLEYMAVGLHLASVISGAVDATLSLEPVGSIAVATKQAKRAITNPVSMFIADPFYSGASVLSSKFIKERPEVARKVVQVIDKATKMANDNFDKYRPTLAKYTAIKLDQVAYVAQPRLRSFRNLDETDITSYQRLVDVFYKEGALKKAMDVHSIILDKSQLPV